MNMQSHSPSELQSVTLTLQVLDLAELEKIEGGCLPIIIVAVAVAAVIITYAATAK
jgi:lactobin A/cerein 7B family class IIb bacteriocin